MEQKTYTLYLVKKGVEDYESVLTSNARNRLHDASTQVLESDSFSHQAKLIVFSAQPRIPKWMQDLQTKFDLQQTFASSSCALLFFRVVSRIFIATFAHGWMYLDDASTEPDFGLKVSVNALDETRLKRLESANLGDALRGVSLSPFHRDFRSFGLDDALDLVRKVSGSTHYEVSPEVMTGARSLKFTGEFSLDDLPIVATESLSLFESNAYKETGFRIIDFVRPVTDPTLILTLDELAAASIRQKEENFELGLPATREDEAVGYKFIGVGIRRYFPDLILKNYITSLGDKLNELNPKTIRSHQISAIFQDGSLPERKWSIKSSLVGSIVNENERYAINEGEWFRIEALYRKSIEDGFSDLVEEWNGNEPPALYKYYDQSNSGTLETEAAYNERLCNELKFVHLDCHLIQIPDASKGSFEACDALDLAGKRFIHVKRSSRRSSILSHFFKQGSNSAQYFRNFQGIWDGLAAKVEQISGSDAKSKLLKLIEDESKKWKIEFWIIDAPRANGKFNIPFFSKISLRDEARRLRAMGYDVAVKFIPIHPEKIK